MTREEAIEVLKDWDGCFIGHSSDDVNEALDMAIKALEQEPKKGHWIYDKSIADWICSKCGETPKTIGYVGTGAFMAEHFKYCNHCGAEMEGVEK